MKSIKGPNFFTLLAGALGIIPAACTLASCDNEQLINEKYPPTGFTSISNFSNE